MKNDIFVDFSWIINVFKRRIWLIGIPIIVSIILSLLIMLIVPTKYKASTTLMVEPSKNYQTNELNMLMAGERLALTYTEMLKSRPILEEVIAELNVDVTVGDLADMITVQPVENTQLIRLSVIDPDPEQAIAFANTISTTFISYNTNLSNENYNQLISQILESSDLKQAEIEAIIQEIDTQNKLKTDLEAEKTRLESLLSLNNNSYMILQQNAQSFELMKSESSNKVNMVEPAFIESTGTQPPYIASSVVFFDLDIITGNADPTTNISGLITRIYSPILYRATLLNKVIDELGFSGSVDTLSQKISSDAIDGTQFLKLSVSDDDPDQALLLSDTITGFYIEQIQNSLAYSYNNRLDTIKSQMDDLSAEMDQTEEDINNNAVKIIPVDLEIERLKNELTSKYSDLRSLQTNYDQLSLELGQAANSIVISETAANAKNLLQEKVVYSGVLVLLAIFAGIGLVFIVEHFDDKVRSLEEISVLLDSNNVSTIGQIGQTKERLIFEPNSSPYISEDFRKLSATIRQPIKDKTIQRLLVTSANPSEGKSFISANLAIVLARTGTDVILVDADYHHPTMDILFKLDNEGGLAEFFTTNKAGNYLKKTKYEKLRILTTGERPEDPIALFSSVSLQHSIDTLALLTDVVLIDSPPILTLADVSYLTPYVDGAILVLRSGITKRKDALEAMNNLKTSGLKFVRVVLNDVKEKEHQEDFNQYYIYDLKDNGLNEKK
jgi:capsular exopolysaccharide synthesis family protein